MGVLNIIALFVRELEYYKIRHSNVYVWMDIMMMKLILFAKVIILQYIQIDFCN